MKPYVVKVLKKQELPEILKKSGITRIPFPTLPRTIIKCFSSLKRVTLIPCHAPLIGWLTILFLGILLSPFSAVTQAFNSSAPGVKELPQEYGEIIYQFNPKSSKQIYIIGISHRDTLTRTNGQNTARVQAEIYKTGEWLIENEKLEVLLPEGFFKKSPGLKNLMVKAAHSKTAPPGMDMNALIQKLSDDQVYVNAEMLLRMNYSIDLQQVEDKRLYEEVGKGISQLVNCQDYKAFLSLKSKLDYLQSLRTAFMLQRIPQVIEDEFQGGNIQRRKAVFTIGLNHISDVLRALQEGKISIPGASFSAGACPGYTSELNLVKENFGVTVILPRTLADDPGVLKATGVDKYMESSSAVALFH
jgi:hypothetical protein